MTNRNLYLKDDTTAAYILLYEIEVTLRFYINIALLRNYGIYWERKFDSNKLLKNSTIPEMIAYFEKYPPLDTCFSPQEIEQLSNLIIIRDKLERMEFLTEKDHELLEYFHENIINRLKHN